MNATNENAKDFAIRLLKGENLSQHELDVFDDWKFEHSTDDVAELIKEAGEVFRKSLRANAIVDSMGEVEHHHEMCLGVLAGCYPHVPQDFKEAIEQGIAKARLLGFPVDEKKLGTGKGIFSGGNA